METKEIAKQESGEKAKNECVYQVAGQDVKLSYQIVRNFLTKGTGTVTDADLTQFISICKYNQLNPFLNEAYLVKFGTSPAQMIVSKEAYMKRADACEHYDGIQAGVIVIRGGEAIELEGCFYLPTDKLAGGWAKVYRGDKKFPIISRVRIEEYDKKQSIWTDKPSTMISKVAKVQALREAFPAQLGAMYTTEEVASTVDISYEDVTGQVKEDIKTNANKETIGFESKREPEKQKTEKKVSENKEENSQKGQQPNMPGF